MSDLLPQLIETSASRNPSAEAVRFGGLTLSYEELWSAVTQVARGLISLGLGRLDRVAIYLPKTAETVVAMFASSQAGCVFVPVNPILKRDQVAHILADCGVRVLVTSVARAQDLLPALAHCPELKTIVLTDGDATTLSELTKVHCLSWTDLGAAGGAADAPHRNIDTDVAAILYTSGSTGRPKGVVLSHRNMVIGAESVSHYLGNRSDDKLLAVLPFSFDYGFSQMSTAFRVGASVTLIDYLLPRDVINAVARHRITGLAGVPPLWAQLADLKWPASVHEHLRYLTNSGGAMPKATLAKLRDSLPKARVFLMYGLTEAFRSTFLPPEELDRRPESIGKAIPNAEILVVRPDGTTCAVGEPGELVHRGSLVALGYWNDPDKTAERFKPLPGQDPALVLTEFAVWSGDTVRRDEDGYLYFVGRTDEMIKTSGYRVSPTEIEEVLFSTGMVADAVAIGVPHASLGQAVVVIAAPSPGYSCDTAALLERCKEALPNFMIPSQVVWRDSLPRNPNGKYDRASLAREYRDIFREAGK